jgi:hypothetical protein
MKQQWKSRLFTEEAGVSHLQKDQNAKLGATTKEQAEKLLIHLESSMQDRNSCVPS